MFEDLLIVQCDHYGASYVIAIDKQTGANRWKTDRPEVWLSWSSPVCVPADGASGVELIVCGSEKMDAFDPRTRREAVDLRAAWPASAFPRRWPRHGLIYATSGPNNSTYAVRPGGRGDVTDSHVVWTSPRGNPFVPSAILVGDYYYVGRRSRHCHLPGGRRPARRSGASDSAAISPPRRWRPTARSTSPTKPASTLVIGANTDRYEELATNTIDEPVFASPAISDGRFFLRSARHSVVHRRRSGSIAARQERQTVRSCLAQFGHDLVEPFASKSDTWASSRSRGGSGRCWCAWIA